MSCLKCYIYVAWNSTEYRVELSHDPLLDLKFLARENGYQQLALLTPALPIGEAAYLLEMIATARERQGQPFAQLPAVNSGPVIRWAAGWGRRILPGAEAVVQAKLRMVTREAHRLGLPSWEGGEVVGLAEAGAASLPGEGDLKAVREALAGRILYLPELELALNEGGRFPGVPLENTLQVLHLMGECTRWPSVVFRNPSQRQCLRCGETQQVEPAYCMDCGSPRCAYCPSCAMMGESRLCRPIYAIPGRPAQADNPAAVQVHLDFALTPAQRDAAAAVRGFIHREGPGECLVWAACGAGKTEVALGAMAEVLQRGGCVLFAIPRRDVVQELEPRLKAAFPGVRVQALYGGSREKYRDAELVVATTHQAIRFFRQFPLVVMDEVDAFPYQGSEMLHYAVERARASDGKVLYLTATPHRELFSRAHRGQVELVHLPARPHGHPLPEPQVVVERSLQLKEGRLRIPETVLNLLHQSVEGDLAQVFVFVPAIHLAQRVGEALRDATAMPPFNHFTGDWVYSSHSRDPDRERKRERFCRGEFPIFVTTTIMERGITVPRVNVLVLFAEQDRVFDEGTLVQVAGRAGRTQEYPGGRVWFVGSRVTAAMAGAVEKVRALNREAYQRGYLLPGYYLEKPAWVEG